MPNALKSLLVILAGLIMGGVVIAAIEYAGHLIYPPPAGLDLADPAAMAALQAHIDTLPLPAFLMVLLAWLFGAIDGALLASWLAPRKPQRHGAIVALLLFLLAVVNVVSLPHPLWMAVATPFVFISGGFIGVLVGARLHGRRQLA